MVSGPISLPGGGGTPWFCHWSCTKGGEGCSAKDGIPPPPPLPAARTRERVMLRCGGMPLAVKQEDFLVSVCVTMVPDL